MSFSNLRGSTSEIVQVDVKGAANNPCFSGSPDIDYEGTITIDVPNRKIKFEGLVEPFPAFEMHIAINDGNAIEVFSLPPILGSDPWNLPGSPNRPVNVEVCF
jgi:hypothetical protein